MELMVPSGFFSKAQAKHAGYAHRAAWSPGTLLYDIWCFTASKGRQKYHTCHSLRLQLSLKFPLNLVLLSLLVITFFKAFRYGRSDFNTFFFSLLNKSHSHLLEKR